MKIRLRSLTERDDAHGNEEGKVVYRKLQSIIEKNLQTNIFCISLKDIDMTDASFPRESVVSIAKQYRGEKGFYITSISNQDLFDNFDYAAEFKKQPLMYWAEGSYQILGPKISTAAKPILDYINSRKEATTTGIVDEFGLTAPNASAKLKKLANDGYILRTESTAETGGVEFLYHSMG